MVPIDLEKYFRPDEHQSKSDKTAKVRFGESFGSDLLVAWIVIAIVYSILYVLFLSTYTGGIWPHIAGFFGLFAPVALLSLMLSVFPIFLLANVVVFGLMALAIYLTRGLKLEGLKKILLILGILFAVTFVADFIRFAGSPFDEYYSWAIFLNGEIPEIRGF